MNNDTTNGLAILNTANIDITKPESFAQFVAAAKEIQGQLEAAWGYVEQQMLDNSVSKVQGDWGNISFSERKNWKVNLNAIDPYFTKPTADTKKLNAAFAANEMPEGADFNTSVYMTKRIK